MTATAPPKIASRSASVSFPMEHEVTPSLRALPHIPPSRTLWRLKRLLDIFIAAVGLVLLAPLFLLISLLILLFSPGPIFYQSLRIGQDKRPFYMYKFRTMAVNTDAQHRLLRAQADQGQELFKMKSDPRVFPLGRFLRAYSLDEFPQLLNVLLGDMSLVGPRPYIPEESSLFKAPYTLRFDIKPGMTGPWQISGRSNLSFKTLCQLELDYLTRWKLYQDFLILLKTIPCVLFKVGAY